MTINGEPPRSLKTEENIDHIFNYFDLATNVGFSINNNCRNLINTNVGVCGLA